MDDTTEQSGRRERMGLGADFSITGTQAFGGR